MIVDFLGDSWNDYSEDFCVPVSTRGLFKGDIHPKDGMKFRRNLILRADFATNLCKAQPVDVLQVLGKKGAGLANVEHGDETELSGVSDNPQLYQVSGWYYGIEAITRIE